MIVVDTNVITYLIIKGEKTALAQQAYRQDSTWLVPRLWRHEFLNVLATFVRHNGASLDEAIQLWQRATLFFESREQEPDMESALELAHVHKISAYDAQFAALAIELGLPLVTEDRQLLNAFPQTAQSLAEFCAAD